MLSKKKKEKAAHGCLRMAAEGGMHCTWAQENLGDDRNVLCFDYGSGFKDVYIC